ncbi:MAG: DNA topoisomerase-1 [Saprospiraceae bacterium]|jgi:DNA topoisomerase-1
MSKNLLIVESPAKAKTIEKILGKDFIVKSSFGHVRDLSKKGVDVENNFKPTYEVSPDKTKVVTDLQNLAKKAETVWLATDEDREGEAIAWHLCEVLDLPPETTKRIVFREITAPAILKAVTIPRTVDMDVVDAQQARRILDRLVGFELSELLWRKVRGKLSAGRVQSVTVKLVVQREREIMGFSSSPFFRVNSIFAVKDKNGRIAELKAELPTRYDTPAEADRFLTNCKGATYTIDSIKKRPLKRKPTAPFTTSTLQQEASRKLGFGVKRTMSNAQRLYEQGFITYMRTDSVNLSETALTGIAAEIESRYGKEYVETRQYKNKKANSQEAHEAIRPTYLDKSVVTTDIDQQKLYDLIWKRAIASQMAEAELEKTTVNIGISTIKSETFKATGEVLKFDGFLKVYLEGKDDEDDDEDAKGILPPLTEGQKLAMDSITATERFTRAPARFTEASLVKKLEELGIGRPSTYAPTIDKIMEPSRGYVTKESREGVERKYQVMVLAGDDNLVKTTSVEITGATSNRLYSTDTGMVVTKFLDAHFEGVMDYSFTAKVENELDQVAEGTQDWVKMLADFYTPFHLKVVDKLENAERASGERILGKDPETGRTLLVRLTRYGVVAQIGAPDELEEDEKPKYANLRPGMSLETVTLEEAIPLFQLPKVLGSYEDLEVSVAIGRFGPYVKHGDAFISLPKGEEPLDVSFERAVELIEAKKAEDAPVGSYDGKDIQQGAGRFGPFLKWNDFFINIPRRYDPENLSKADMDELIAAKVEKEANRYIHRWEDLKLSVENARWGPEIKWNKKRISIPKKEDGTRVTAEEAVDMTLEEIKELVEQKFPKAFEVKAKKKRAPAKKKVKTDSKIAYENILSTDEYFKGASDGISTGDAYKKVVENACKSTGDILTLKGFTAQALAGDKYKLTLNINGKDKYIVTPALSGALDTKHLIRNMNKILGDSTYGGRKKFFTVKGLDADLVSFITKKKETDLKASGYRVSNS